MGYRWGVQHQLLPPDIHTWNSAEQAIWTFKAQFLAILSGIVHCFPRHLWDLLLPQTKMTLNLLRQAIANPAISTWEFFNGKFNYNATPLGPLGISVIVHTKTGHQRLWDFCGKYDWIVGASMTYYCCQLVIPKLTRSMMISDTTEFRHHHITKPSDTHKDIGIHGLKQLTSDLQDAPSSRSDDQIHAPQYLQDTHNNWSGYTTPQ